MARITLFPKTASAQIDGKLATDIDYTGIDASIHCVQWYDTVGTLEYVDDPITGAKPPNDTITSIAPYTTYVAQAESIIDAYLNPQLFYSTSDSTLFQGNTYGLGDEIVIYTPNTFPPGTSTDEVPGTPEDFQELFWYAAENTWVLSPVDPTLTLSAAKSELISKVQTSAAEQGDLQARIYSAYQLGSASDIGTLSTADYFGVNLSTYQTYLDGQVSAMTAEINAATAVSQLYSFDWRVEGDPNA